MNSIFPFTVFLLCGVTDCYRCDVSIVGGGISGLYMAYRLLKTGNETHVCIFEKDSTVGGRVRDFRFAQTPDVHVGLGAWRIEKSQENMRNLVQQLEIPLTDWTSVKPSLIEFRGIKANNTEDIKKGYPSLLAHPVFGNMTSSELFNYALKPENVAKADQYATYYSYLSDLITPEGREYLKALNPFKSIFDDFVNPRYFVEYILTVKHFSGEYVRPVRGMSAIILQLTEQVQAMGGRIFTNAQVQSLIKRKKDFFIKTSKLSVNSKKLVVAATPKQFQKISGSIARRIQDSGQFNSIQTLPIFKGATVYEHPWWKNLEIAGTPIQAGQEYLSSSNCLGLSVPYWGKGLNGEGVLNTIYSGGNCARRWHDIATMDKNFIDDEVHRALETKYGTKIPAPLDTVYQFWDSGWHLQKSGTPFTMADVSNWAKRPLEGEDVFVVGEAYNPCRAWCEGAIVSCKNALKEGWGIEMDYTESAKLKDWSPLEELRPRSNVKLSHEPNSLNIENDG